MDTRDLDTDEVAAVYDDLLDTYRTEWQFRGHRSLHLSYYDDQHDDPGEASINTMRLLSEAAGIDESDRVLNIGCGAGEDSVWNARAHGAHVVGVNISERQLELARENARNHGVEDLTEFRFDDFHELETVADGSVDVVWGLEALSHSPNRRQPLEQARRVLATDGRVAFTDLFVRSSELSASNREDLMTIDDALGVRLGPIEELERILGELGFGSVEIRDVTEGIEPCTERRHRFSRIARPVGSLLWRVGVVSATQVEAFAANSLIHQLVTDGVLGYYLITADR